MLSRTSVYFTISKLIQLFLHSFHVPCIIVSNVYFYILRSMFPFLFNQSQSKELIEWVIFFWSSKYYFALFNFLKMFIFTTLFWHWSTLWNSMSKVTTFFGRWNRQRWFDVVQRCKFQHWNALSGFNVDLTLSDVPTSYHPNNNVETTLKYLLGIEECC